MYVMKKGRWKRKRNVCEMMVSVEMGVVIGRKGVMFVVIVWLERFLKFIVYGNVFLL